MRDWEGLSIKQYVVGIRIGTGAQSVVYQARHQESGRVFAIKFWSPAIQPHQLLADIAKIRQLDHPHIITIIDDGVYQATVYMVMQLADGGTLEDLFAQPDRPKLVDSLKVLKEIAQALDYLHQNGVVHRDLKPSNILLDDRGRGYLSDFGLVNFIESSPELIINPQEDLRGTVAYMAPEIWESRPIGSWTDIYALGIIAYQMLAGQPPFAAANNWGIAFAHVNTQLPPISETVSQFPQHAEAIIARATAKDPQERYASAIQFMDDLSQAIRPWLDQHISTDMKSVIHPRADYDLYSGLVETVQTDTTPLIPGYTVIRSLTDASKGGMADLYLARRDNHSPTERYVIKIPRIKVDGPGGEAISAQFKHEVELLCTLDHPNIIQIIDYGECEIKEARRPFFVTPYMEGKDLRAKLNKGQLFTLAETSMLLQRLGEALDYAYQKNGTIHLDIKPDNLLFNRQGEMVLSDFGLGYNQQLTLVESFMYAGTIQYCSPEQLTKRRDQLDQRADVYAAGVLLFEMLSGQRPFARPAPKGELSPIAENRRKYEIIRAHLFDPIPSLFNLSSALEANAPEIQTILEKALAKKAEDRFVTVSQLVLAIKAILPPAIAEIETDTPLVATYTTYRLHRAKWRGRQVIIQLFKDATGSPAVQKAFVEHARLLHQLDKDHIAFVHAEGFDAHQRPYLLWDNPGGSSLASLLQAKSRLSLGKSKTIIRSLALAIDHAHERGVAHLNIRPETILMDAAAKPSLIAFDLPLPYPQANSTPLADGYLSPEQQANQTPTRQTDVYYAGRSLFTMLTGVTALPSATTETPLQLNNYRAGLHPKVQVVLNTATAKDPGQRYESVTELAQALEQVPFFNNRTLVGLIVALLGVCTVLFFVCAASLPIITLLITPRPTSTVAPSQTPPLLTVDTPTTVVDTPFTPIVSPTPIVSSSPIVRPATFTPTSTPTPTPTLIVTPTETATETPTVTPVVTSYYVTLLKPINCDDQAPSDRIVFEFRSSRTINADGNNRLLIIIYRRGTNTEVHRLSLSNQQYFSNNNLWQTNSAISQFFRSDTHDYEWRVFYNGRAISPHGCFRYNPNTSSQPSSTISPSTDKDTNVVH